MRWQGKVRPNRNWWRLPLFTLGAVAVLLTYQIVPILILLRQAGLYANLAVAVGVMALLEVPVIYILARTTLLIPRERKRD